jgi:hypothetical protein
MSATTQGKKGKKQGPKVNWNQKFRDAVMEYGVSSTMEVICIYLNTSKVHGAAVIAAEHHPAFQVIRRSDQVAIHNGDESTLRKFVQRLLFSLCREFELAPADLGADDDQLRSKVEEFLERHDKVVPAAEEIVADNGDSDEAPRIRGRRRNKQR